MITEIVSFGGHAFYPDYEAGFVTASEPRLPGSAVQTLERIGAWPVIVALTRSTESMALLIRIVGSDRHALRSQLFRWFDPEDETPKVVVAENHDGVEMYRMALCQDLRVFGDQQHDTVFVVTLVVDGDVRWRSVTPDSEEWNITATGQTHAFVNGGEDEAYPVLTIEPTGAKTGGYTYRRWVPVVWRSRNGGAQYPVMATLDTASLTPAKMQADGDDLRVLVDGSETYRWLDAMDTAATKIWWSMDFTRAPDLELEVAIAGAGDVASIQVDDEVELALMPESGIVLIDSEAFVYTGRNLTDKQLTGISRAAKGTAAAAHDIGDTVHWIQHDVYLLYGNATATDPASSKSGDYEPAFELDHSDNDTWVYEEFGDAGLLRAGRWQAWVPLTIAGTGGCYTATERTLATPYSVIGAWKTTGGAFAQGWYLDNPCGIVNAAWTGGKVRAEVAESVVTFRLRYWIRGDSWWTEQHAWMLSTGYDPLPAANTWYSQGGAGWKTGFGDVSVSDWSAATTLALIRYGLSADFEMSGVTVSLLATEVPLVTVGDEEGNYELAATITNQTTGEAITVAFVLDLDSELEINTDERTVTWLLDGSGQFQALSLSTPRRHWLRLLPGNNTLRWNDVGTNAVTLTLEWEERYY